MEGAVESIGLASFENSRAQAAKTATIDESKEQGAPSQMQDRKLGGPLALLVQTVHDTGDGGSVGPTGLSTDARHRFAQMI
jgi:hypothetical protein